MKGNVLEWSRERLEENARELVRRVKAFDKEKDAIAYYGEEVVNDLDDIKNADRSNLEFFVKDIDNVLSNKELLWDFENS